MGYWLTTEHLVKQLSHQSSVETKELPIASYISKLIGTKWSQSKPSINPEIFPSMATKRPADTDIEGETPPVRFDSLSARPARPARVIAVPWLTGDIICFRLSETRPSFLSRAYTELQKW